MNLGTSFTESEAILAAGADETGYLDELVRGMHPGERKALAEACERLERFLLNRCAVCDGRIVLAGEDPDAERWWGDGRGHFHERCKPMPRNVFGRGPNPNLAPLATR